MCSNQVKKLSENMRTHLTVIAIASGLLCNGLTICDAQPVAPVGKARTALGIMVKRQASLGTIPRPNMTMGLKSALLYDDFNRPDTEEPSAGYPLLGDEWVLIGPGGQARSLYGMVQCGYLTASKFGLSKTIYACQVLRGEPIELTATFRWEQIAGEGPDGLFVMACGPSNTPNWIHNIVHVRFHRNAVILDFIVDGIMYSEVALWRFPDQMLEYGVDHNGRVVLDWNKGRVLVYLNGQLAFTAQHELVKRLRGRYAFWEEYYGDESPKSKIMIREAAAFGLAPFWAKTDAAARSRTYPGFKTLPSLPTVPDEPGAVWTEQGAVEISWTDTNEQGALTDIEFARSSVGPWTWIATVQPSENSFVWTSANYGTVYWFRIRARNNRGPSAWTDPFQIATEE